MYNSLIYRVNNHQDFLYFTLDGFIHYLHSTRIYYQFRDLFPDDLVQLLLENTSLLVTGASREVVGASLKFLKVKYFIAI